MSLVAILLAASGPGVAVPFPADFPTHDFVGGPLDGMMGELRGETTKLPPLRLMRAVDGSFAIGMARSAQSPADFAAANAQQSFRSEEHPSLNWSGEITHGLLAKYNGCVHTAPWHDESNENFDLVHFYWSCDRAHPYIIRTDVKFLDGKVVGWDAHDLPPIPVMDVPHG